MARQRDQEPPEKAWASRPSPVIASAGVAGRSGLSAICVVVGNFGEEF